MDPDSEAYRQTLAEGTAWAVWATRLLGWLLIGAFVIVAGLLALGRAHASDRLGGPLRWLGAAAEMVLPTLGPLGRFAAWLVTRRITAVVAAGFTLAAGVYLSAFGLDGGWLRRRGRLRCVHPDRIEGILAAWTGRARVTHRRGRDKGTGP